MINKIIIILSIVILITGEKECERNGDCIMEGSVCKKNECVCTPGMTANSLHTKCLTVSDGYGSLCEDNVQCSEGLKGGGVCKNGTCSCSQGYHYFLGQCWKSSGLGEECKRNENCFVGSDFEAGVCSEKKVCVCALGYYQREYSNCRRESYSPGDPCGIYLDCKFDNAVCNMNRTCESKTGAPTYYNKWLFHDEFDYHEELFVTELSSKVGDSCKKSEDCPKYSECNEAHKCTCQKGYYAINSTKCLPELGAKCQDDSECIGKNTQCRNGTVCVCKQGYVTSYDGRYCDKMSRDIGWSCLRDEQCGLFGPRSVCIKKKCGCDEKSHYIKDKMFCWVQKLVGESCTGNEDCGSGDSVSCEGGTCQCAANTHPSSNNTDCRKDSNTVGEPCVEDLDCTLSWAFCNSKTNSCDCLQGYISNDGKCISGVGGKCQDKNDCKAEGSSCLNDTCTCESGFVGSKDYSKCLPIVDNITEPCSQDTQCAKLESTCKKGFCSCLNGSHYVEGWQCFLTKRINETCTSYGNCSSTLHSTCYNGKCQCVPGFYSVGNTCKSHSGSMRAFQPLPVILILIASLFLREVLNYSLSTT